LNEIETFCRKLTKDFYRFDPFLHLRFDRNAIRNKHIVAERLTADEIIALEQADPQRWASLKKKCDRTKKSDVINRRGNMLFQCNAGNNSFTVGYDGGLRICSSFYDHEFSYDLRRGSLTAAWNHFIPKIRNACAKRTDFVDMCGNCAIIDLCYWCPAHACLETGEPDAPVDYFCQIAKARKATLDSKK
jgi:radical SAM protein with 4Fe4S-binding SPASM domain